MNRQAISYIVGIGIIVLIVAFVILLLVTRDAPKKDTSKKTTTTQSKKLVEYANSDARVSFATVGEVTGNEQHREIKITIDQYNRVLETYTGYQGQITSKNSFSNNSEAYRSFLAAIDKAGFAKKNPNPKTTDIAGLCPFGLRYLFGANGVESYPENLWTTSCSPQTGTFGGNLSTIRQLFQLQIPDYSKYTQGVNLN